MREDYHLTLNQKVIGSIKNGVLTGGIFYKEGDLYIKTDGMVACDMLLYSMLDYYDMRKTPRLSESVSGSLLRNITSTRAKLDGIDDDVYFQFSISGRNIMYQPSIHNLLCSIILADRGVVTKNQVGFSARLSGEETKLKVKSKTIEAMIHPKATLLHKSFYELICTGYYVSTKAHNRLGAVLARIYSDASGISVFSKSGEARYVDLSSFMEYMGYNGMYRAIRNGVVDFRSCSDSRFGFKTSALLLSALHSLDAGISIKGNTLSYNGQVFEYEDDISRDLVHLDSHELDFIADMILLCGSDESLDLNTMSVNASSNIIQACEEVLHG